VLGVPFSLGRLLRLTLALDCIEYPRLLPPKPARDRFQRPALSSLVTEEVRPKRLPGAGAGDRLAKQDQLPMAPSVHSHSPEKHD
jgi:hypothetical protein